MNKVFIANDTLALDFRQAEKFGQLVPVTTGPVDIFNPDRVAAKVRSAMHGFNKDSDYLLICGSVLACCFAFETALDAGGPIRLLLFDSKRREYFTRTVDV